MKLALLYLRVSSKEQLEEGYSLDAQEKLANEYAARKNLDVVRTWKVSESAWREDRKAFRQLADYAVHHPEIRHIIFDTPDRMTRNDFDKLKVHRLIINYGKTIHFSRSNRTMDRNSGPEEEFMFDIEVAVAKKISNDISRRTSMGMREKAEQGHYPSVAPVGYANNPLTHRIEIDLDRAPHIKNMFILMADGNRSLDTVRVLLARQGFRSRTGKIVPKSGVARYLSNPVYYGDFFFAGKRYQGSHDPIITKELFDRVQTVLGLRRRPKPKPKTPKRWFAFNGLLRCALCGCKVIGEIKKERFIYYHCTFSKGRHGRKGYYREHRIAEMFEQPLKTMQTTLELPNSFQQLYLTSNYEQKGALLKLLASNYILTDATIVPTRRKPSENALEGLPCP